MATAPRAPMDRQAPRARARKSTAAEIASTDLDRVEAETDTESDDWLDVPLTGRRVLVPVQVRVLPFPDWPRAVYRQFRNLGDMEALAQAIHPDDRQAWLDADVTVGEIGDWTTQVMEASGQAPGESTASPRSSTRTRGR